MRPSLFPNQEQWSPWTWDGEWGQAGSFQMPKSLRQLPLLEKKPSYTRRVNLGMFCMVIWNGQEGNEVFRIVPKQSTVAKCL
jgi:hypothetical protein